MTKKQMTKKQQSKKTLVFMRITIGVVALIILIAAFFFVRSIVDKRILQDSGEQVTGIVEARDVHMSTSRSTGLTSRMISYSFTPEGSNEKVTQNDFNVSRKEYEKYPVGAQISVTYLPANPSMNQPTISLGHMSTMVMNFLYLFLAIVVAIFTSRVVKKLQAKYNIKSPSRPFYFTSLAGFIIAFIIAAVLTVLISRLVSTILS